MLVVAGVYFREGVDLDSISLPKRQDEMIEAVNPNTVVVLKNNAAALMPWIDRVQAVMEV